MEDKESEKKKKMHGRPMNDCLILIRILNEFFNATKIKRHDVSYYFYQIVSCRNVL